MGNRKRHWTLLQGSISISIASWCLNEPFILSRIPTTFQSASQLLEIKYTSGHGAGSAVVLMVTRLLWSLTGLTSSFRTRSVGRSVTPRLFIHECYTSPSARRSTMKRSTPVTGASPNTKKRRVMLPEYCSTECMKDETGVEIWPAPAEKMQIARDMIVQW